MTDDPSHLEYETGTVPVFAPKYTPASKNWTILRALRTSFPDATYLEDILRHADSSVVFQNTLMPIYQIEAARLAKGGQHERGGQLRRQRMDPRQIRPETILGRVLGKSGVG